MKTLNIMIAFVSKEWLAFISGIGLLLTSVYAGHFPSYSRQDLQVLFILFALFVVVSGLYNSGLLLYIAQRLEQGRAIPFKLVASVFFLSMLVTNDVALMAIVPLTLSLSIDRKNILVILEALAANAGSALSPFGNPQNLFIYWFYNIDIVQFIEIIAPFSVFFLLILLGGAFFVKVSKGAKEIVFTRINGKAYIYGVFIFWILFVILHLVPVATALVVLFFAWVFDRESLRIDYGLLLTFLFFFGLAENMKGFLASEINHAGHVFLFSALASQVISNVPAALLFAKFTSNWPALLWGVNAGGFGSLFGSLANLIAYKIYINDPNTENTVLFTMQFFAVGYIALFLAMGLYFFII